MLIPLLQVGLSKENDIEALKRGEQPKKWVFPLHVIKAKPQVRHPPAFYIYELEFNKSLGRTILSSDYEMGRPSVLCYPTHVRIF